MRSRFFSSFVSDPKAEKSKVFAAHLGETLALAQADLDACLAVLPKLRLARAEKERSRIIDEVAAGRSTDWSKLQRALSVMFLFLEGLLSDNIPQSDSSLWADDLADLGWINESSRKTFEALISRIQSEFVEQLEPEVRRRRTSGGVLPVFAGCGATVEIRSVQRDFYDRGTVIEDYEPEVLDVVTVASIHMAVDVGTPRDFYFQADEEQLDYLIAMLQAVKKDISALRVFLKLNTARESR